MNFDTKKEFIDLYRIWPGKNKFLLNGKIMIGPKSDLCANILTWLSIIFFSVAYFTIIIPHLWENLSPLIPCCGIYLFISTIFFLIKTTLTDPGIIPRKKIQ